MASVKESVSLGGFVTKYSMINFSTAKQNFSFGKDKRFPSLPKKPTEVTCYDLPPTFRTRTCGFGIGDRF